MTANAFTRLITLVVLVSACAHTPPTARTESPERLFMEASLSRDPAGNPQLVFLLFGQYASSRQFQRGVTFFEARVAQGPLGPELRAVYLAVIGALRAQMADQVPLLKRIGWVERATDELDEAVELTSGKMYIVRWLRAIVFAQLPDMFEKRELAERELAWAEEHIADAPTPGLLREVVFQRARLLAERETLDAAAAMLKRSGYPSFERAVGLNTPFSISREKGFQFNDRVITEVVPGRLYQATGYDFMEYYFLVSEGGKALIAIDCGAREDAVTTVLDVLRARFPSLPPVKAVLVTHAHWDHVGGQRAYRKMAEPPTFWASAKWEEQLHHQEGTGGPYELWWGTRFDLTAVTSFRPDETVAERKTVTIDGTEIEMIPVAGGETRDGLLFHFKGLQTVFGGDFVMPYIGAPFMEEGNPVGLADAIATLKALAPKRILHGHEGINRLFPTGEVLFGMEAPIRWLVRETEARLAQGQTKEAILHANLTPEQHFAGRPELELPYIVIREHLIKRVADLKLGYWQVGITGADDLTPKELGSVLVHYAGLDLDDQASLIESMVEAGDHALALRTVDTLLAHAPDDARLRAARRTALLGLIEQEQVLDAFKFIWYSGEAGFELGEPK